MVPERVNSPLFDEKLNIEERLDYLLKEMTLEEKLDCLTTHCKCIPRLGIRDDFHGLEAAHGIEARHDQEYNKGEPEPTTCFPQPIGMSSSFDRDLIRECGRAVGEEARGLYNRKKQGGLCRWAPTVDMERDPRWGRNEEAYGEDPYLTGEMAGAYIEGLRGDDPFYIRCGATLKHFYANNVETDRVSTSSSVDERNKYEYYFEPFRRAVMHGAEAVMTSYNEINGIPAVCNEEVLRVAKQTWGLPGHVVCDGGDFSQTVDYHKYFDDHSLSVAAGLKAGIDCFTDRPDLVKEAATRAYETGLITTEDIDTAIRNAFRTRIRLGFFDSRSDSCQYSKIGEESVNSAEHQAIQRKMAEKSLVLLKNDGLLPMTASKGESIAVIGPLADTWNFDWYGGIPPYRVTPLEGIKKAFPDSNVFHTNGLDQVRIKSGERGYLSLMEDGRLCLADGPEKAEIFTINDWGEGSVNIRCSNNNLMNIDKEDVIRCDRDNNLSWFVKTAWKLEKEGDEAFVSDGDYKFFSWKGESVGIDQEGFIALAEKNDIFTLEPVNRGIDEAVGLATEANAAIVILGSDPMVNSKEEVDRKTIAFPKYQEELALKVHEANPNTVVVIITNYPYAIRTLHENIPAIILSPSGAQDLGTAVGKALSGAVSPSGRLPQTWYEDDSQLGDINDYDIIRAGRTYRYFEGKPLYPFGYGLSYGRFAYGEPVYNLCEDKNLLEISISVSNIGQKTSDEVIQVYARKERSRVKSPKKQLVGFARLSEIDPGTSRRVKFVIDLNDLKSFDVISRKMILEESDYTFMVGSSSADIRRHIVLHLGNKTPGPRDAFANTLAISYDEYENCIIHRGVKGHAANGETCVMPGIPGVTNPKETCTALPMGRIVYRDMSFSDIPKKLRLNYWPKTAGTITLCMIYGQESCEEMVIDVSEAEDFDEHLAGVPLGFCKENAVGTLEIEIEGDIRLRDFCFG